MDRQLTSNETKWSKRLQPFKYFLVILVTASALWYIRALLSPKIDSKSLHIVAVERGDMINTLSASGTVVPAFEREINAPVATEISKVIKSRGDFVKKGEFILALDEEYTRLIFDQLRDELALRRNNIDKLKLEFDKNLRELDYKTQIQKLQVSTLEAQVTDQMRLMQVGGATAEELEQAELNLKVAHLQESILENELAHRRSINLNEKKGLELEYQIQEKKLAELNRKLKETTVRAPEDGVITWINEDLGRKVQEGETLVKLANLNKFVIEASSSDRNSTKIQVGMPIRVIINETLLDGQITSISPAVENNTIQFIAELDKPNAEVLRPNLRVEVFIITDNKTDVLRVKNGPAFRGAAGQFIYVVDAGVASKRRINKGLVNSNYVEILDNLEEGERIIISSMDDFDHLESFDISVKN